MELKVTKDTIRLSPAGANEFDAFKTVRKRAMRTHVERQGMGWDEEAEDKYHRELFDTPGLYSITCNGFRVGYVGMHEEGDKLTLSRFCLDTIFQGRNIGRTVLDKIIEDPRWRGRDIYLDSLHVNQAQELYKRYGFELYRTDEILAYYRRPASPQPASSLPQTNKPVPGLS